MNPSVPDMPIPPASFPSQPKILVSPTLMSPFNRRVGTVLSSSVRSIIRDGGANNTPTEVDSRFLLCSIRFRADEKGGSGSAFCCDDLRKEGRALEIKENWHKHLPASLVHRTCMPLHFMLYTCTGEERTRTGLEQVGRGKEVEVGEKALS